MHLGEWAGIYCRKKWKHATRCYKMLQRLMLYHVVSQRRYTNLEPIQRQTKALVWLFTLRSCFECWCLTCLALGRGYWNLFCTASIWLCAIVVGTALKPNDSAEMIWIQLYNRQSTVDILGCWDHALRKASSAASIRPFASFISSKDWFSCAWVVSVTAGSLNKTCKDPKTWENTEGTRPLGLAKTETLLTSEQWLLK